MSWKSEFNVSYLHFEKETYHMYSFKNFIRCFWRICFLYIYEYLKMHSFSIVTVKQNCQIWINKNRYPYSHTSLFHTKYFLLLKFITCLFTLNFKNFLFEKKKIIRKWQLKKKIDGHFFLKECDNFLSDTLPASKCSW